ncbi:MAG: class I SAM-dependent methyltransferase [Pedobacter sp.]|nr:class I SAM-dependent methyltransferase [Pedobacter sp.]MDQ8053955.1 class I SAM-dependent methyltransferase [Pedobacter sp.]
MADNFKLYSQYYDLLNQGKDYVGEANYVADLISTYSPGAKSILELGSGTGKHANLLAEKGYRVMGLERSPEMVAIAEQTANDRVKYKVTDITDFDLDQQFDVAISLFHVVSYLTTNQSLIQTFKNVDQHLRENGLFIFDVWHSSAVNHQIPEKRTRKFQNKEIEVVRKADPVVFPERNVVEVNFDITITNQADQHQDQIFENHPMRHFSAPEIEILAYATGFEVIHSEEFQSKAAPSVATWGVCYILRKKGQS